jgi:hypothetical protein
MLCIMVHDILLSELDIVEKKKSIHKTERVNGKCKQQM